MGFCPQCGFEKADYAVFCSKCGFRFQNKSLEGYEAGLAAFKSGDCAEAVTTLSSYLKENPGDADAWNVKGVALAKIGQYQAAIYCYDKALALQPGNEKFGKNRDIVAKKISVKSDRTGDSNVKSYGNAAKNVVAVLLIFGIISSVALFIFSNNGDSSSKKSANVDPFPTPKFKVGDVVVVNQGDSTGWIILDADKDWHRYLVDEISKNNEGQWQRNYYPAEKWSAQSFIEDNGAFPITNINPKNIIQGWEPLKFKKGDVIVFASDDTTAGVIIEADQSSHKYLYDDIFKNDDGSWGWRNYPVESWATQKYMEESGSFAITNIHLANIINKYPSLEYCQQYKCQTPSSAYCQKNSC